MPNHTVANRVEAPVSLTQCGICKQEFSRSLTLSQHLNNHGIEWKVYWDMYLHHVSGLACNLCNTAHTDVYSLESHLKMTHCIKSVLETSSRQESVSVGVMQGNRGSATPAQVGGDITSVVEGNKTGTNIVPTTTRDNNMQRPSNSEADVTAVLIVKGNPPSRGRGPARGRGGSSHTIIVGANRRGKPPGPGPTRAQPTPSSSVGAEEAPTTPARIEQRASIPSPTVTVPWRRTAVPSPATRGRMTNVTPGTRGARTLGHRQQEPDSGRWGEGAVDSDEVTEVGRVVTVPLDRALAGRAARDPGPSAVPPSPSRSRRGRPTSQTTGLDVIEVVDVDQQPTDVQPAADDFGTAGRADSQVAERPPPSSYQEVLPSRRQNQKPTAVVQPYDSQPESAKQPASSPVAGVRPSSSGIKLLRADGYVQVSTLVPRDQSQGSDSAVASHVRPAPATVPTEVYAPSAATSAGTPSAGPPPPATRVPSTASAATPCPPACTSNESDDTPLLKDLLRPAATGMAPAPPLGPSSALVASFTAARPPPSALPATVSPHVTSPAALPPSSAPPATASPPAAPPAAVPPPPPAAPLATVPPPAASPAATSPVSTAPLTAGGPAPKPALLPWLDPVYQPGTLTRLSEQAAALSGRPDSPSQRQLSHGQLRRLVDRSQRLMVGGFELVARDPSGNTMPVHRLLAAAESDQMAGGPAGDGETLPAGVAESGSGDGQPLSAGRQDGACGRVRQPLAWLPQPLTGAGRQTASEQTGGGACDGTVKDKNMLNGAPCGSEPPGAGAGANSGDVDAQLGSSHVSMSVSTPIGAMKSEPYSPVKSGGTLGANDTTWLATDNPVKQEPIAFHPSVGIDVSSAAKPQLPHDESPAGDTQHGPTLCLKLEPVAPTVEVKAEPSLVDLEHPGVVKPESSARSPSAEPFDLPVAAGVDGDPLAVDSDDTLSVGTSDLTELLPGVTPVKLDELLDPELPSVASLAPVESAAPAAPQAKRWRGSRSVASDDEADAAAGGSDASVGKKKSASARQDTAARRRRKKHNWGEKRKKGGRALYSKPEGTGDGEIDPGNMVEVLFLNDDDGQEDYDALDAMVMKVDTSVRPTRYYVHFKDMAHRHDRWVTRPDISRVYRFELLPIQTVEPARGAADRTRSGVAAAAAGLTTIGADQSPESAETARRKRRARTEPAQPSESPARGSAESDTSNRHPSEPDRSRQRSDRSSARRGRVRRPGRAAGGRRRSPGAAVSPGRGGSPGVASPGPTVRRLAFIPDAQAEILPTTSAVLERGRLVQVVYEVTADGAQLICPAKIVKVNDELSYRRYLVRYLGWQRRYREWVTDTVIRCPPAPDLHNAGGQILRRCVVAPPSCPEWGRAAYSSLRPCSVDLAAGNLFFLAARRPLSHAVKDARIAALKTALRPRRDDSLGSLTAT